MQEEWRGREVFKHGQGEPTTLAGTDARPTSTEMHVWRQIACRVSPCMYYLDWLIGTHVAEAIWVAVAVKYM